MIVVALLGVLQSIECSLDIEIDFDTNNITFKYLASERLKETYDDIHKKYYKWIDNLRYTIQKEIRKANY